MKWRLLHNLDALVTFGAKELLCLQKLWKKSDFEKIQRILVTSYLGK